MILGEQPGDEEDLAGRPFIGPAGKMLDNALMEAGISRKTSYVTNSVKHFKFGLRGKKRIHMRPNVREIDVCADWLLQEIEFVKPRLIIGLGASSVRALTGRSEALHKIRGKILNILPDTKAMFTIHPSYLLRLKDHARSEAEQRAFVADLRCARTELENLKRDKTRA